MSRTLVIGLVFAAAIVAAYCQGRASVPDPIEPIPQIVTRWETVTAIDTAWRERVIREARTDTFRVVHQVTVTVPETVLVHETVRFRGIEFVSVPQDRGDTMVVEGRAWTVDTAGTLTTAQWRADIWTAGPLRVLSLDSFPPRVSFWTPPRPAKRSLCGASATAGYAVLGRQLDAVVGFGCRLALPVLPWPF